MSKEVATLNNPKRLSFEEVFNMVYWNNLHIRIRIEIISPREMMEYKNSKYDAFLVDVKNFESSFSKFNVPIDKKINIIFDLKEPYRFWGSISFSSCEPATWSKSDCFSTLSFETTIGDWKSMHLELQDKDTILFHIFKQEDCEEIKFFDIGAEEFLQKNEYVK
jgi:hypothetical protein